MKKKLGLIGVVLCVLAAVCISGCATEKKDPDHLPRILYGKDACAECGRVISEIKLKFSAAVSENGQWRAFDDIGCLGVYMKKHRLEGSPIWVHDYVEGSWLPEEEALLLRSPVIQSPMGYGIAAFKNPAIVNQFLKQENGVLFELQDIRPL